MYHITVLLFLDLTRLALIQGHDVPIDRRSAGEKQGIQSYANKARARGI